MSFKAFIKGWWGEVQGTLAKKIFLNASIYFDLNNITLPTANGSTQIDHVIVSRYGVFVVESKNMKGWIFGEEHSPQWTQVLYDNKYLFQNPLRQNYRHTKALSEFLNIDHNKFFSVIMFWGDCKFKTAMPDHVLNRGYTAYIKSKTTVLFSDEQVQDIVTAIQQGRLPKNYATHKKHVADLKKRFEQPPPSICPQCNSRLVLRTARTGNHAGSQFYGCSQYPACRYMANVQPSK
jgi:restriction system protein